MPTYQYECAKGHSYEEIRKITEEPKSTTCAQPLCGTKLKRKFTAPTITFNGTGFNTTRG